MTKTEAAFRISVKRLFKEQGHCYFWTFTFRQAMGAKAAQKCWHDFMRLAGREWKKELYGLRVIEVHPGDELTPSHGVHYHVLLGNRHPWQVMQRLWVRCGGGEVLWVDYVSDMAQIENYLAPYLSPTAGGLPKGTRRWAKIGKRPHCLVRNIFVKSELAENCRRVRAVVGGWSHGLFVLVNQLTFKYGNCLNWPSFPAFTPRPEFIPGDADESCVAGRAVGRDGMPVQFQFVKIKVKGVDGWCKVMLPSSPMDRLNSPF